MPSFRGEKADERHLCQFYHSEAEMIGTLDDVINLIEEYIKYISSKILVKYGDELREMIGDISHIERLVNYKESFPRITFDDAEKELKSIHSTNINEYIEYNDGWRNITSAGEKEIMNLHNGIVWITNYDILNVPFYQKFDNEKINTAKNADLLMGIGETVGCGERHYDYNEIIKSLKMHEVDEKEYDWYINMKKQFPLKTSGFGMGVERYLMWLLKCDDIRNLQVCTRFNGEKNIL